MSDNKPKEYAWIANEPNGRNISNKHDVHTAVFEKPQNPPWTKYVSIGHYGELEAALKKIRDLSKHGACPECGNNAAEEIAREALEQK